MTRLEEIKFACHCAAMEAIDAKLTEELGINRKCWVLDKHLPALLPAIDRAIEAAMREVYDLMPESLDVHPADAKRAQEQMAQSLANIAALQVILKSDARS